LKSHCFLLELRTRKLLLNLDKYISTAGGECKAEVGKPLGCDDAM